jgi:hypothetical protein
MSAYEFSALIVACLGLVVAVLALSRRMQIWLLPSLVALLLMLVALPLRALEHYRVWSIAGALMAEALGIGGGLLIRWLRHRPPSRIAFFDVDSLVDGTRVEDQDVPMTISGSYTGQARAIRVVLQDASGRYYLQHPEVTLGSGGQWSVTNVRPGYGITKVLFVQVGSVGKKLFDAMVDSRSWGSFTSLPSNSCMIGSIAIECRRT